MPTKSEPRFVVRVSIKAGVAMGPGKAALLRGMLEHGSLAAAARALPMSYSRAWLLVKGMNEHFKGPLVELGRGGATRGGASVTPLGVEVLELYEAMQAEAEKAVAARTRTLSRLLK